MNAAEILKLMKRSPFEPFEVRLDDGARIRVDHPSQIATFPESPTCVIYESADGMQVVAFRNMTEIVAATPA